MPQPEGHPKPRTFHSKSRTGCGTCKKRHIKCDEQKPTCTNCRTRGLHCPFQDGVASETTESSRRSPTSLGPSPSATGSGTPSVSSLLQNGATDVSVLHLDLFNHFLFQVCPSFTGDPRKDESYRSLMTTNAFNHQFLLWQMLGAAALSRYLSSPNERYYKALAMSFQEKAIAGLDDVLTKVNGDNCVAVVLFVHLVGIQSFCETFSSSRDNTFSDFLEALIGTARLLRGIEAVYRPFWNDLVATEVGDFMKDAISRYNQAGIRCGDETASLYMLIQNADISGTSRETYENAIARLQRDFDEVYMLEKEGKLESTNTANVWLITSSPAYLHLLGEARPEALVILAYYAVALHRCRTCWAIGTAGYTLIKSVRSHLGRQWSQWLLWPQSEIGNNFPDLIIKDMTA